MENLEKNVLKKTNKYVYLSNGTHMSHSDFHRYKQDVRNELAIVHAKQYKDSIEVLVQSLKQKKELEDLIERTLESNYILEYEVHQLPDTPTHDWEKSFRTVTKECNEIKDKVSNSARKIYSQFSELPILKDYQNDKGIKFIIQQNYYTDEYRFCFDPYELGPNYHSNISEYFRNENWGTINGGWLKAIDNTIVLYKSSGDYGIYDDTIAIECAKKVFKNKKILSFSNTEWDKISF